MKILIVVKSVDGGTGTYVFDLLKIRNKKNYKRPDIKILALERPSYRKGDFKAFEFLNQKAFYPQKYSFSPVNMLNIFRELKWILKHIKSYKPDIVLGIDFRCNLLVILSQMVFGRVRSVLTTHIDLASLTLKRSNRFTKSIFIAIVRYFYSKADILIAVSSKLGKNLKKDFGIKKSVKTIYNGIQRRKPSVKRFITQKKKIIISVARLSIQKDYPTLINAVDLVNKKYQNFELHIVSNGPEKVRLQSMVKKLGLSKKIKFLGWVEKLDQKLGKSDLFVLSSKAEGFGYVLLEAMGKGLPVISTDCPYGPSEVLQNGKYGMLVSVGDAEAMATQILSLVKSKSKYEKFSKLSIARSGFFSLEKVHGNYMAVFEKLVNSNNEKA